MLKLDPIWVLVPMAVASMVSDLLAENPGVLPAMSRQVITRLARAILGLFGTAFVVCNICFPPSSYIENKVVNIQANRNNRLGHVNYSENVAGLIQRSRPYGLCCGVLASRVEINCSAAGGAGTAPARTISLAETSLPYTRRLSPLSGRIVEPSRETPANKPRARE